MDKIKVYVNSVQPSSLDYIDMKSVEHPCSQAGDRAFEGMKYLPAHLSGFLSDEEIKAIGLVKRFCEETGLEFEVVDLASRTSITKMKFILKGRKTPAVEFKGEIIEAPTKEKLEAFLSR